MHLRSWTIVKNLGPLFEILLFVASIAKFWWLVLGLDSSIFEFVVTFVSEAVCFQHIFISCKRGCSLNIFLRITIPVGAASKIFRILLGICVYGCVCFPVKTR